MLVASDIRDGVMTADVSPKRVAGRPRIRAVRFGPSRQGRRITECAFGAPADLCHSA
jgi:hypothetical protein